MTSPFVTVTVAEPLPVARSLPDSETVTIFGVGRTSRGCGQNLMAYPVRFAVGANDQQLSFTKVAVEGD